MPSKSRKRAAARRALRLTLTVMVVVVIAQTVLSALKTSSAYELDQLQAQLKDVNRDIAGLQLDLEKLDSPQNIALQAEQMGMTLGDPPGYLRLSDQVILGPTSPHDGTDQFMLDGGQVPNSALAGAGNFKPRTTPTPTATPHPTSSPRAPVPASSGIPVLKTH